MLAFLFFFFNLLGIIFTCSALLIVAHASRFVGGDIRRGVLSLLWGLFFILFSFGWSILTLYKGGLPDMQPLLLMIGMVLILISTKKLFSLYTPPQIT